MSSNRDYDPVTAEVIASRVRSIVSEAAITIARTSGSPVITGASVVDVDGAAAGSPHPVSAATDASAASAPRTFDMPPPYSYPTGVFILV